MRGIVAAALVLPIVYSCSTGMDAIVRTVETGASPNSAIKNAVLQPNVRYLRVEVNGRVALFALGFLDAEVDGVATEVWYGSGAELLRLHNGHVVTALGFPEDLQDSNVFGAPNWHQVMASGQFSYRRRSDVMPGYRYGLDQSVTSTVLSKPPESSIQGIDPSSLTWFEESASGDPRVDRFAVRMGMSAETVLYSEQCPTQNLCLKLQEWPPGGNLSAR